MTKRLKKPKEGRCKVCGSDCASLHEFCEEDEFWDTCSGCDEEADWSLGQKYKKPKDP